MGTREVYKELMTEIKVFEQWLVDSEDGTMVLEEVNSFLKEYTYIDDETDRPSNNPKIVKTLDIDEVHFEDDSLLFYAKCYDYVDLGCSMVFQVTPDHIKVTIPVEDKLVLETDLSEQYEVKEYPDGIKLFTYGETSTDYIDSLNDDEFKEVTSW